MAERFFRAIAHTGELHLRDLHDWEDWNSERVEYRDEAEVSWLMRTGAGERRIVCTAAELDAALKETTAHRSVYLYVSERLIEDAKRRWEEMKQRHKNTLSGTSS
jgi:hypothetical protein